MSGMSKKCKQKFSRESNEKKINTHIELEVQSRNKNINKQHFTNTYKK